ncbi:MAG TPA: hypothetical protein VNV62_04650 [Trebonia sp.]|nr:hypothetical protein [Trebonia sp.]
MLTHQQILHFAAFGYVTLRGLFSRAEAAALRDEATSALADAFGPTGTEPAESDGISGDYLPLSVDRAPFSQSLTRVGRRQPVPQARRRAS